MRTEDTHYFQLIRRQPTVEEVENQIITPPQLWHLVWKTPSDNILWSENYVRSTPCWEAMREMARSFGWLRPAFVLGEDQPHMTPWADRWLVDRGDTDKRPILVEINFTPDTTPVLF